MSDSAKTTASAQLTAAPAIEKRIIVVRGRQAMLDEDLADLYGVETRRLIEQVKRNRDRFPEDFMFQLTKDEAAVLRSQIAISNSGSGGRRYAPYVFTEQGVAMLSGVLKSKRAVAVGWRPFSRSTAPRASHRKAALHGERGVPHDAGVAALLQRQPRDAQGARHLLHHRVVLFGSQGPFSTLSIGKFENHPSSCSFRVPGTFFDTLVRRFRESIIELFFWGPRDLF